MRTPRPSRSWLSGRDAAMFSAVCGPPGAKARNSSLTSRVSTASRSRIRSRPTRCSTPGWPAAGRSSAYSEMSWAAATREASRRCWWAASSDCCRAIRISIPMSGETARSRPASPAAGRTRASSLSTSRASRTSPSDSPTESARAATPAAGCLSMARYTVSPTESSPSAVSMWSPQCPCTARPQFERNPRRGVTGRHQPRTERATAATGLPRHCRADGLRCDPGVHVPRPRTSGSALG
jgi:hypothetical protein